MTPSSATFTSTGPYNIPPSAQELAARLGVPLASLCKLDANESPYGPPPSAVAALARLAAAPTAHVGAGRYPDPTSSELRAALAGYTGIAAEQIVVGNGLDEVIALLADAFVKPGDEVVVAEPTFNVYAIVASRRGARVVDVGTNERFEVEPDRLSAAIGPKTRLVLLCAPNNPTGTPLPRETALAALERAAEVSGAVEEWGGPLVVVDEAYFEFGALGGGQTVQSSAPLLQEGRRVAVLRTFSKLFGLAGLRIGYALCPPDIVPQLSAAKLAYNVNLAGQVAARAALDDLEWLAERARWILAERERVSGELARLPGLRVYPSAANFVLAELEAGAQAREALWAALLDRGILVRRPPGARVGAGLRITIGAPEQNDRLLAALRELLWQGGAA
jgi:histidinol-phosphate aminotransferase